MVGASLSLSLSHTVFHSLLSLWEEYKTQQSSWFQSSTEAYLLCPPKPLNIFFSFLFLWFREYRSAIRAESLAVERKKKRNIFPYMFWAGISPFSFKTSLKITGDKFLALPLDFETESPMSVCYRHDSSVVQSGWMISHELASKTPILATRERARDGFSSAELGWIYLPVRIWIKQ